MTEYEAMKSELSKYTVPHASGRGGQDGVLPPGRRKYTARYKAVTCEEAKKLMIARMNGTEAQISGGLSDTETNIPEAMKPVEKTADPVPEVPKVPEVTAMDTELHEETLPAVPAAYDAAYDLADTGDSNEAESAQEHVPGFSAQGIRDIRIDKLMAWSETAAAAINKLTGFVEAFRKARETQSSETEVQTTPVKITVRHETAEGMYNVGSATLPSVGIDENETSITVFTSGGSDDYAFTPSPGSDIILNWDGRDRHVFFPGTSFALRARGLYGLSFVKAE